jgi:hypothetical protein
VKRPLSRERLTAARDPFRTLMVGVSLPSLTIAECNLLDRALAYIAGGLFGVPIGLGAAVR